MALDLGEKRIGVALTDQNRLIAAAHSVFPRTSRKADFAHISQLAEEQDVSLIVVGLPLQLDGAEGPMAQWARDYGRDLCQGIGIPVVFWDESLTSVAAEQAMQDQGINRKKGKKKIDAVAAALILQSYLEGIRDEG